MSFVIYCSNWSLRRSDSEVGNCVRGKQLRVCSFCRTEFVCFSFSSSFSLSSRLETPCRCSACVTISRDARAGSGLQVIAVPALSHLVSAQHRTTTALQKYWLIASSSCRLPPFIYCMKCQRGTKKEHQKVKVACWNLREEQLVYF